MYESQSEKGSMPYAAHGQYSLLDEEVQTSRDGAGRLRPTSTRERLRSTSASIARYSLVSILFLLVMVTFAPGLVTQMIRRFSLDSSVVSLKKFPMASEIRWEMIPGDDKYWSSQLYMGEPSTESEIAWNHLIPHGGYRITDEELPVHNLTAKLPLANGGYGALVGVDHNLHCLRQIHQVLNFEHYYGNSTTPGLPEWARQHTAHCMESLRRSVMCQPDLNLFPFYQSDSLIHPINPGQWNDKECVDWQSLQKTLLPRRFVLDEFGGELAEMLKYA